MGFFSEIKAMKAYQKHNKGDLTEARKLYEEALAEGGLTQPRYILAYGVLLIRSGDYQKAKDLLVKFQKAPGMTADQKTQLFMNYAACCYKLGDIEKGIGILERQHAKQTAGLVYETLGYLYVEKYAQGKEPDFDAIDAENAAKAAQIAAENAAAREANPDALIVEPEEAVPAREAWQQGIEKSLAFCQEAVEYDDEDAICLDNMGQFYYRVLGDRKAAEEWFRKAIAIKESQIDTLWFLSRYDLEKGDKAAAKAKLEKALEGRFSPLNYADREKIEAEIARL